MNIEQRPWYKEGYLWLVIMLPAVVVVAAIATLVIAARDEQSLVTDDYYKAGLAINTDKAKLSRAESLGIKAVVQFQSQTLLLSLKGDWVGEQLILTFNHPTLASRDTEIALSRVGDEQYIGHLPTLAEGPWNVMLQGDIDQPDQSWRINRRITVPTSQFQLP
ncbi:MAG: FixH family protein [Gammaproteobacteria bacterium]|nr:FixH family protein [Gammaproteobacteria bacterium]